MTISIVDIGTERYIAALEDAISHINEGVFDPCNFYKYELFYFSPIAGAAIVTEIQMHILRKTLDALNSN